MSLSKANENGGITTIEDIDNPKLKELINKEEYEELSSIIFKELRFKLEKGTDFNTDDFLNNSLSKDLSDKLTRINETSKYDALNAYIQSHLIEDPREWITSKVKSNEKEVDFYWLRYDDCLTA